MRKIRKTITKTPAIIDHGRAMHPVVRAAFKAVELLIKWLEGSTPSSSANILHKSMVYIDNEFIHTNLHTNRILLKPIIKSSRAKRTKIYQDRDKAPLPPLFFQDDSIFRVTLSYNPQSN